MATWNWGGIASHIYHPYLLILLLCCIIVTMSAGRTVYIQAKLCALRKISGRYYCEGINGISSLMRAAINFTISEFGSLRELP